MLSPSIVRMYVLRTPLIDLLIICWRGCHARTIVAEAAKLPMLLEEHDVVILSYLFGSDRLNVRST